MSESRGELIQWVNQLTGLGIAKVEQCGKGFVCAQIFDSIYGDVPLKKIDFNANAEFKYLANWKIVQTHFNKHKIDKVIPVERLAKCKMQDNLEFLQWSKKYWDQMFPGGDYNATARRGGPGSAGLNGSVSSHQTSAPPPRATSTTSATAGGPPRRTGVVSARATPAATARVPAAHAAQLVELQDEVAALNEALSGLELERGFYFTKLRSIEMLIQDANAVAPLEGEGGELIKQIQDILYSTEEGFEVPEQQANEDGEPQGTEYELQSGDGGEAHQDDDEVF